MKVLQKIIVRTWSDIDALTREQLDNALTDVKFDPSLEPVKYEGENFVTWEMNLRRFKDALVAKTAELFPEVQGLADELVRCLENDLPTDDLVNDIVSRGPGVVVRVYSLAHKPNLENLDFSLKVHRVMSHHVLESFGVS